MLISLAAYGFTVVVCAADVRSRTRANTSGPSAHDEDDSMSSRERRESWSDGRPPGPQNGHFMGRQVTVFSTTTSFETSTTFAGNPTTSTVQVTFTETLTILDPSPGRTTQTLIVTSSLAPQKRTVTPADGPVTTPSPSLSASPMSSGDAYEGREPPTPKKRQEGPGTTTSVITILSKKVITVTPTILVTNTARISSTITVTPPISSTISVVQTVLVGTDNQPVATLTPSTQTALPTETQSPAAETFSSASTSPSSRTLGIAVGTAFGAVVVLIPFLYLCLRRRRRRRLLNSGLTNKLSQLFGRGRPADTTSADSPGTPDAAERGAFVRTETFAVGGGRPASVARSASEERRLRTLSVLRWGSRGADAYVYAEKDGGGAGSSSPRHPSAFVAPLTLPRPPPARRHGSVLHDSESESWSDRYSGGGSVPGGLIGVEPPSPVASSGVFGDEPRSPSPSVAEDKEGDRLSDILESSDPSLGSSPSRPRSPSRVGGEEDWEEILAWPERPERLSRRRSRREKERNGGGQRGEQLRWHTGLK